MRNGKLSSQVAEPLAEPYSQLVELAGKANISQTENLAVVDDLEPQKQQPY